MDSKRIRTLLVVAALAAGLQITNAAKPPSAQEQAAYQNAVQTVINSVNAYRKANVKSDLTPIVEFCRAARLDAESALAGETPDPTVTVPAANYKGVLLGYAPGGLFGNIDYDPAKFISTALSDPVNGPDLQAVLLDSTATQIGVGIAMRAKAEDTELTWFVDTGKQNGATVAGATGIETDSGRGLPNLDDIEPILDGRLSGDSIGGFILTFFTPDEESDYVGAKASFTKKASKVKGLVGKSLKLNIPFGLSNVVQSFKIKGKLPPGVKFNKKQGGFGGFVGTPTKPGTYKVKLTGTLSGAIDGSTELPPISLKFVIGG